MKKVRIGCISTRREVFSVSDAIAHKNNILKELKNYDADIIDIEDINEEGLLFSESDVSAVVKKMKEAEVDGVFFPHCNFGSEDLVGKAASAIRKPVLLWGPRDDAPLEDGLRTRDTQCGLFATGKVLRRFNVPFTYIENSRITDDVFKNGFRNFTAVCAAVRDFNNTRILQIAPRPAAFWTVICNEGELLEKFGIQIFPVTLVEIVNDVYKVLDRKDNEYKETLNKIKNVMDISQVPYNDVEKLVALKVVISDFCRKYKCNSAAIQCWNALQDSLGIMPCMINGLLTEEGIPVVCEMDIHGAITAVLLQAASLYSSPIFFADLTVRHPTNDNAELLWHCGNFPPSLAKENAKKELGRHFIFPAHMPGTGEWEIKGGDITICRFDGDHGEYRLFAGEGKGTEGPKTKGTYVWFEVANWPEWERKLVEGPYIHHCAGVHGSVAAVLKEVCKYIPGLQADYVE